MAKSLREEIKHLKKKIGCIECKDSTSVGGGTDNQNIERLSLSGTILTVGIENGDSDTVDLGAITCGNPTPLTQGEIYTLDCGIYSVDSEQDYSLFTIDGDPILDTLNQFGLTTSLGFTIKVKNSSNNATPNKKEYSIISESNLDPNKPVKIISLGVGWSLITNNVQPISNYDVETDYATIISTATPYYLSTTGNDSNDGLSVGSPKLTVANALSIGALLIYMAEGNYHKSTFGVNYNLNGNGVVIIGVGKVRLCSYHNGQTWSNISGNAWQTTQSNASTADGVIDLLNLDADGCGILLTQVLTEAECIATAGTWHVDAPADKYTVHMGDGRQVQNGIDMTANLTGSSGFNSDSGKLLMKNIEFMFDISFKVLTNTNTVKYSFKNCSIPYPKNWKIGDSATKDGLSFEGVKNVEMQNIFAKNSRADILNYHNLMGTSNNKIIEIDCKLKNPSFNSNTGINQCSTTHDTSDITRINPTYINGDKDTIKDVGVSVTTIIGGTLSNDGSINPLSPKGVISVTNGTLINVNLIGAYDIEGTNNITLINCTFDDNATLINATIL